MSGNIVYVTDGSFQDEVLNSPIPVLLDFWAEWCGPCRMIAPILDELSVEYAGKVKIAKMNVDQNQAVPAQYNIRGIPALLFFKNGQMVAQKVGAGPKGQFSAFIDANL